MPQITLPHEFSPRGYQLPFFAAMSSDRKRVMLRWARRHGKDLCCLHATAMKSMQRVGNYFYALPYYNQARKAIWDGKDREGRPFMSAFPEEIVTKRNEQEMKLMLANGSMFQLIGTDNIDSIVGSNPVGIVFSEFSLSRPEAWDLVRPILAENGGWAVFNFTPRGENHAYDMEQIARENPDDWFVDVRRADETDVFTRETLEQERREIVAKTGSDALFRQEYLVEYLAASQGSYYGEQMELMQRENRIGKALHDPQLPVYDVWDLGISDSTAVTIWQAVGRERRLVEAVEYQGRGLPDIIADLKRRNYVWDRHFAPHDIRVRELGTGKSRLEVADSLGWHFEVVPQLGVQDGIDATRAALARVWADAEKAKDWLRAMRSYQRGYSERLHSFSDSPLHDWASHYADSTRYAAIVFDMMGTDAAIRHDEERELIRRHGEDHGLPTIS